MQRFLVIKVDNKRYQIEISHGYENKRKCRYIEPSLNRKLKKNHFPDKMKTLRLEILNEASRKNEMSLEN